MRVPTPLLATLLLFFVPILRATDTVTSPDGRLIAAVTLSAEGAPHYLVTFAGQPVLLPSRLGLVRDDEDFTHGLRLTGVSSVEPVRDDYELLTGKRRLNHYRAQRRIFHFTSEHGHPLDIVFQVSNDGVAFRYVFPETSAIPHRIAAEASSFHFPAGTRAWLQPMSVAKTGWKSTNPSYEEHYQQDIPVGTPSTLGAGWVFPALFRAGTTWIAVSETAVGPDYCGSRLGHESPGGEYAIGFPDPRETMHGAPVTPVSMLPWATPWRILAVGDLRTVAESTLGTDLATPAVVQPAAPPQPGKASWSWPLLGDNQTTYAVQKRFIDYAADMHWDYCLIDSMWDQQIGYEKIQELSDYARTKNVRLLLWYNSNGNWNDAPQTPKDRIADPEVRRREFTRIRAMGIVGVKIDFLGGDGQPVMAFYHDILRDAATAGLLVNFHGATLPRGWTRTYPHLMTMEAIKGFEFITFTQENADAEPAHCATIPFTRNLFEAMDFTPMCLDRLPGKGRRRTTAGFELALSVLFTSGIQHYPEIPEGMAKMPDSVRAYLRHVPATWDDTRFLDGYPARYVVLARQGDGRWFVAGINGESSARTLTLDLSRVSPAGHGTLLHDDDGQDALLTQRDIRWSTGKPISVTLPAHGGFVLVIEP